MIDKVYILKWDYNHSGDSERDAFHVPFKDDDKLPYYFSNPGLYGEHLLPKVIYFQANFNVIPEVDYPLTDLPIPIMSLKMVDTLTKVTHFEFNEMYVLMLDDTYPGKKFDKVGQPKSDIRVIDSYRAVRLTTLQSYFDFERSDYKPSRSNPQIPSRITKIVLKQPKEGFPSVFKLDILASELFISSEAKEALEKNNIKGCIFEEVSVSNN
jgi:hypothetical protein